MQTGSAPDQEEEVSQAAPGRKVQTGRAPDRKRKWPRQEEEVDQAAPGRKMQTGSAPGGGNQEEEVEAHPEEEVRQGRGG
jgi:hypothetical protein